MTRFWWVRHGPTHAKGMVGWTDLPADLSDTARIARLTAFLPDPALVISSDLIRASATADAIENGRNRLAHDPGLREIHFGDWEMKRHSEIEAQDPQRIRAYWDQPGDVRAPGGETWNEALARVSAAVDRLIDTHKGADIIVVAHFGAIVTQIQRALDLEPYDAFSHRIDNLSVTQITFDGIWRTGPINHIP
ncbi:MAG: histidine phosphatase family protein [Rhodobacter sp.]|nr:histidine phosphatase family protein [Rhodobacter sp.]